MSLTLIAVSGGTGSGTHTLPTYGTASTPVLSSFTTKTVNGVVYQAFNNSTLPGGTQVDGYIHVSSLVIPDGDYWVHHANSGVILHISIQANGKFKFGPLKVWGQLIGSGVTYNTTSDRYIGFALWDNYLSMFYSSAPNVAFYPVDYGFTFPGLPDWASGGDSPYNPPSGQAGAGSTPGGGGDAGQGNGFPSGTNVGVPDSKKDRAAAACANIYLCSAGAIKAFTQCLWGSTNTGFIDAFFKRVQNTVYNPIESVITCHSLPTAFTPGAGVNTGIKAGGVDFSTYEASAVGGIVTSEWVNWNSSSFSLAECWASYADYNHMSISLHLPFCGVVPLEPSEVVGGSVQVVYWCNVLNGNCAAFIVATDRDGDSKVVKVATGNAAQPCPISGNDRGMQQKLGAAVGFAQGTLSAAAGALSGNSSNFDLLGNYLKFGTNWALAPQHTAVVGSLAGAVGFAGSTEVFIILDYEYPIETDNYSAIRGRPSEVSGIVSDFPGYAELELHADGIATATEAEKRQIEQLCRQGVIV